MVVPDANNEDLVMRRRRIRYRAWHRGTQEMDLVLGHFVDAHVENYDRVALDRLEQLMDEQDTDLLRWVMGQEQPPEGVDKDLLNQLTKFQIDRTKP